MRKTAVIKDDMFRKAFVVAPGVWGIKDLFVNVYLVHNPVDNKWVLVDAGLRTTARKIRNVAQSLFWPQAAPSSIILTHGHFDHIGSLEKLAAEWEVPVYAHYLEAPYLTGRSAYPPPDPCAGGGMMSLLSFSYPKGPTDLKGTLLLLPEDGTVPGLPEWKYIHTPGHTPGHISLYRERDGVLIAGDAVVTTQAESMLSVLSYRRQVSGPPKYFTYDWLAAENSVRKLAELEPEVLATGHGRPLYGAQMKADLYNLLDSFPERAVPRDGRYTEDAAVAGIGGVEYIPPVNRSWWWKAAGLAVVVAAGILIYHKKRNKLFR